MAHKNKRVSRIVATACSSVTTCVTRHGRRASTVCRKVDVDLPAARNYQPHATCTLSFAHVATACTSHAGLKQATVATFKPRIVFATYQHTACIRNTPLCVPFEPRKTLRKSATSPVQMADRRLLACMVLFACLAALATARVVPIARNLQADVQGRWLHFCKPHPDCNTIACGKYSQDSCERKTKDGLFVCWDHKELGDITTICDDDTDCRDYPSADLRCIRAYSP